MEQFIMGATAMAFAVAGLFFLRFWRRTRDRLFLIFAVAFIMLGVIRAILAYIGQQSETHTYLYIIRFFAFALILLAIIDKNWKWRAKK